jgi:hypothetical protein
MVHPRSILHSTTVVVLHFGQPVVADRPIVPVQVAWQRVSLSWQLLMDAAPDSGVADRCLNRQHDLDCNVHDRKGHRGVWLRGRSSKRQQSVARVSGIDCDCWEEHRELALSPTHIRSMSVHSSSVSATPATAHGATLFRRCFRRSSSLVASSIP